MELTAEQKERAAIVDEYGALQARIAESKPDRDRAKLLADQIQSWYADEAPEQAFVANGQRFNVIVSIRKLERKVTKPARLFAILGKARFLELARVALETIDRVVPKEQHEEFLIVSASGVRTLRAVPKVVPIDSDRQRRAKAT